MSSLYVKLGAGLLVALLFVGIGYKAGSHRWETKYQALTAENWKGKAEREASARKALEGQLRDAQKTANTNSQVIHDLHEQTAAIAADRDHTLDLVHRLLARQARPAASPVVPQATDQSGAPAAGQTGGDEQIAELLADASDECRGNAAQLNALIAQIRPQL